MQIDGTLRNAIISEINGYRIARGHVFGDRKDRFNDGDWIRTSYIVEGPDENGIIKTRNSVYQLELFDPDLSKAATKEKTDA